MSQEGPAGKCFRNALCIVCPHTARHAARSLEGASPSPTSPHCRAEAHLVRPVRPRRRGLGSRHAASGPCRRHSRAGPRRRPPPRRGRARVGGRADHADPARPSRSPRSWPTSPTRRPPWRRSTELGEREPLYVKTRRRPARARGRSRAAPSVGTAALCGSTGRRIVREASTALRVGAGRPAGVLAVRRRPVVEAPEREPLDPPRTPDAGPRAFAEVERYGRTWRTIAGMFDARPTNSAQTSTWCSRGWTARATEFQRAARRAHGRATSWATATTARRATVRSMSCEYALRSVHMYAPWVRGSSSRPTPPCRHGCGDASQGHDRAERGVLRRPVGAADAQLPRRRGQLHRIPGLAEHFLYSNDDMFFGRL